jgi:UDPglucose 6-dehydrogenase
VCVVGTGYVGLTTAVCLAELGHDVAALDIDAAKIGALQNGVMPFYEPGLGELTARAVASGRLRFTTDYAKGLERADFAYMAVPTPMGLGGEADLVFVRQAVKAMAGAMSRPVTIVNKSTVPIGTGDLVSRIVREHVEAPPAFSVVSHPEFLREGSAVADFMHPDRLVFGAHDRRAAEAVAALYARLNARVLITDLYSAEMIKYASNAFLATRISFINEVARICERVGADVGVVAEGMGLDRRIGPAFLNAGVGFGGSCFPKDVRALAHMAKEMGYHPELLDAVLEINASQRRLIVEKVRDELGGLRGRTIGVLGLSFKPDTDDIREAPALTIIQELQESGATVRCYDPVAMPAARRQLTSVTYCEDAYAVADGADALLIVTEWNEFRLLDLGRIKRLMRRAILVDGRNLYEPQLVRDLGFVYRGVGRC